ncbi:hypothetical protein HZY97_19490 [Sphingomonas sp. R-74633]|uniref:alkaline phosphatase D family protein n=1 Tax=Sphingomonas sp. R-74633 TaxID=2751188 RepID=UPI0015D107D2|nr:alkaline phosphatase D family protein [Sphingomonas sp. R-74633]NYT42967.1 hypothetical protein [Sphingomonas sp. R-74633]
MPDRESPAPASPAEEWRAGDLRHILPTANHNRFLLKASFERTRAQAPLLAIDGRAVAGIRTDVDGRFWRFDADGLQPDTAYTLQLTEADGTPITAGWPLRTFPDPAARPKSLRILSYTCAGGHDGALLKGKTVFLNMPARRRLLARGMSYRPDVVIANGDQIYWDLTTTYQEMDPDYLRREIWEKIGKLDTSMPMMHGANAPIFMRVCDAQIAGLYGNALRSTPVFFVTDDHDFFDNDEYTAKQVTLPPDSYGIPGAEQTQHMYYPEFLPDANRPAWLPGGDKAGLPPGTNMCFGTLRYGALVEAVFYDCRRYVNYKGDHAMIVPQWVEDWLIARTAAEDTTHFFHVPSLPFAYSSGKLGDWYPDFLDKESGQMVLHKAKAGWQRGWFGQHQRLIAAMAAQTKRVPVIIQGDFHATAAGSMYRSGEFNRLAAHIHVVLTGTLATGDHAFPSSFRAIESKPSQLVGMHQAVPITEKNGFSIIDIDADRIVFRLFTWRPPQDLAEIDTMAPAFEYVVERGASG